MKPSLQFGLVESRYLPSEVEINPQFIQEIQDEFKKHGKHGVVIELVNNREIIAGPLEDRGIKLRAFKTLLDPVWKAIEEKTGVKLVGSITRKDPHFIGKWYKDVPNKKGVFGPPASPDKQILGYFLSNLSEQ